VAYPIESFLELLSIIKITAVGCQSRFYALPVWQLILSEDLAGYQDCDEWWVDWGWFVGGDKPGG